MAVALGLLGLFGCKEQPRASGLYFAAYGDCRHNEDMHGRIVRSLLAATPEFVLVTGDMVDHAEDPALWARWGETTRELRSRGGYYCAAGNHDLGAGDLFQKALGLKRLYYDHREGDIHLFVLDSNQNFTDSEQMEWLRKAATESDAKHKIAVFHHPPFMIDDHRGGEALLLRPHIHPVLVSLKFCAAFCGHQHAFYTTLRDGVRYVVTAGGGAPLWKLNPSLGQKEDRYREFHHFVGFFKTGTRIEGHVYSPRGVEVPELAFLLCDHP
jgi:hypothetical protein